MSDSSIPTTEENDFLIAVRESYAYATYSGNRENLYGIIVQKVPEHVFWAVRDAVKLAPAHVQGGVFHWLLCHYISVTTIEEVLTGRYEIVDVVYGGLLPALATRRDVSLVTLPYAEYLQTSHWQTVRAGALERSGHRCQVCNSDRELDVHHRTYERRGCERDTDVIALCRSCHALFHGKQP